MQVLHGSTLGAAAASPAMSCWEQCSIAARRPSDVGHKLLLGTFCPLTVLSAVENVPVVNGCRLDGRTDGILLFCQF